MAAITTPSAPSRLTSSSSWRLASCRDSLTSSVQPATSALPAVQRACRHRNPRPRGRGGLQLGLDAVIAEQEYRNGLAEA
jgi:hypothetical protein